MNADGILEIVRDVFGRGYRTEVSNGWVKMPCPLSTWTHQTGKDSNPSAGISVNDTGTSVFNCLAGYTRVITRSGLTPISLLSGTSPELLMPDGTWLAAPVREFGVQPLKRITVSRNGRTKQIYATAGHRWFYKSSYGSYKECDTSSLRAGMRLQSALPLKRSDWAIDPRGVLHGLVFGDGTRATHSPSHGRLCLFGECRSLAIELGRAHGLNVTIGLETETGTPYNAVSGQIGYMKELPTTTDSAYLLGFLSGLIAADGCVDERGNVSVASASLKSISKVQDIAVSLGLSVFGVSGQRRLGLGRSLSDVYTLRFVHSSLDARLFLLQTQRSRFSLRSTAYERLGWVVRSVGNTDRVEKVYCAEVPGHHAFALEGNIVTGNCFTCGNKAPIQGMLRKYSGYTGDDLEDLIRELDDEAYLGVRELPSWDQMRGRNTQPDLVVLDPAIYLDLYDSAAGHPYLAARGISDETAQMLQLMVDPADPVDGEERILFPVFGLDGRLHGLSGRAVNPGARLKVRDYPGLSKARCLLGAHLFAQPRDKMLIAEGLFDYANAWQCGQPAVSAMHSTLTVFQAEIAREIGLPTYLFYDNDQAGDKGVTAAGEALAMYQPVMKVRYPEVWVEDPNDTVHGGHWLKDPGELLPEEFEAMIRDARLY